MRRGLSATEVLVSATLLVAMIGLISPLTARVSGIWTNTRQYRLAFNELANKMETLSLLDESSCSDAIKELHPSESVLNSLPEVQLRGEIFEDSDGPCLLLSIDWNRGVKSTPITLVGWLNFDSRNTSTLDIPSASSEEVKP